MQPFALSTLRLEFGLKIVARHGPIDLPHAPIVLIVQGHNIRHTIQHRERQVPNLIPIMNIGALWAHL
jgi:hypothetical protein